MVIIPVPVCEMLEVGNYFEVVEVGLLIDAAWNWLYLEQWVIRAEINGIEF